MNYAILSSKIAFSFTEHIKRFILNSSGNHQNAYVTIYRTPWRIYQTILTEIKKVNL